MEKEKVVFGPEEKIIEYVTLSEYPAPDSPNFLIKVEDINCGGFGEVHLR